MYLRHVLNLITLIFIMYVCIYIYIYIYIYINVGIFMSFNKNISIFPSTFFDTKQLNNHLSFHSLSFLQQSFFLLSFLSISLIIQTYPKRFRGAFIQDVYYNLGRNNSVTVEIWALVHTMRIARN